MKQQILPFTYMESINRVIYYIDTHVGEDFDLEKLASVGCFSPFHFHRIIRAYLHEPLWNYVIRQRLETAARLIRYSDEPIGEIIFKVGYDSPSAFSRAFKKRFAVSPQEYRVMNSAFNPEFTPDYGYDFKKAKPMKEKIVVLDPVTVVYIESNQGYREEIIEGIWNRLTAFMKKNRLFWFNTACIGISLDDPKVTAPGQCRYQACFTVRKPVRPEGEVCCKVIEGGRYAVFRHTGPYENFENTYDYIYGQWLCQSSLRLRHCPGFEKYLNQPGKTRPEKLKTDIYIPIE